MVLLALATFVELGTRIGYHRLSRIQRRMHDERAALSRLRTPFGKPTLLLVGNSILLEGVDYPAFEAGMAPEVQTFRFIVEQTGYIDWYYGSRRLFAEGIRPTYLVIGFPAPHLNFSAIRGDYGAHYLFDLPGLID